MSDEITVIPELSETAPAVSEAVDPHESTTAWHELTDSQKLDIIHMKIDAIGNQTSWIGQTLSGIIDMVGKVSPVDIFKMMRGGK